MAGGRLWTEEERRFLAHNYRFMTNKQIAEHLGRSPKTVSVMARLMGLYKRGKYRHWTEDEIQYLRDHYLTMKVDEIARRLGRSPNAVMFVAKKLGLTNKTDRQIQRVNAWTKEDIRFLSENIQVMTYAEIAWRLGRTKRAVEHMASKMGLRKANIQREENVPADRNRLRELRVRLLEIADKCGPCQRVSGSEEMMAICPSCTTWPEKWQVIGEIEAIQRAIRREKGRKRA